MYIYIYIYIYRKRTCFSRLDIIWKPLLIMWNKITDLKHTHWTIKTVLLFDGTCTWKIYQPSTDNYDIDNAGSIQQQYIIDKINVYVTLICHLKENQNLITV